MQQLQRSYIFEFAGMPQSGKTAVREILAHYLKRMEYPLVEFNGGSRYSGFPIYDMPIGQLNERLAKNIEHFMHKTLEMQNSEHKIYLLDRGIIDRCIFTDALVQDNKVSPKQAEEIYQFLAAPEFLEKLEGVFIFVTSPETALAREYEGKLVERAKVRSQGDVMNEHFLGEMRLASEEWNNRVNIRGSGYYVKHTQLIDTTSKNTDMQEVALGVFASIKEQYPELALQLASA
jgi:thymidylate kinase